MKFKNPLSRQKFYRKTINDVPDMILELLLYATCFFPFIQFVYLGSDTQPYGALVSLLIIIVCWLRDMKMPTRAYSFVALIGVIMAVFGILGLFQIRLYMVFRSYFTYFSLICIPLATYIMMKKRGGMNDGLTKLCIWIWFLVGFVQKYFNPEFCYSILSRHTTSSTRGTVGLAAEPSAYGYVCLFLILIAIRLKKNAKMYVAILLIQIVVFAGSSVTLVYLAVYVLAYALNEVVLGKKFAIAKVAGLAGGSLLGFQIIRKYASGIPRMQALVNHLFTEPEKLLEDGSIQMRLDAIKFCFQSFFENNGLPHGLSDWKYMTGTGTLFYECGFIAIPLLVAIGCIIWKSYLREWRLVYVIGFMITMLSAIPFSSPIVCFYLGGCVYEGWRRKHEGTLDM